MPPALALLIVEEGQGKKPRDPLLATKTARRRRLGTRQPECAAADRPTYLTNSNTLPLSCTHPHFQVAGTLLMGHADDTYLHCGMSEYCASVR